MSTGKDKKTTYFNCVRYREERKRLKLNQDNAGKQCGVSREMWGQYERGEAVPGGEVLLAFAALGADLTYISTGNRSINSSREQSADYDSLSKQAKALVDNWEHCPKGVQTAIAQLALAARWDNTDNTEAQK